MNWFWATVLALSITIASFLIRLLTVGGAALACVMGVVIFGLGQIAFSLPILLFFISSSLLSKVRPATARLERFQKSGPRDFAQVFANGAIPTLLLICWYISSKDIFCYLFITSVATAAADTWSTEVGILSGRSPRSILTFQKVPAGTSGGVTLLGSGAAVAGALLIVLTGFWALSSAFSLHYTWKHVIVVTCLAFIGQVIDSVMGAKLQAQFRCLGCQQILEGNSHCPGHGVVLLSGSRWVNNDSVNFLSVSASVLLGWFGLKLYD